MDVCYSGKVKRDGAVSDAAKRVKINIDATACTDVTLSLIDLIADIHTPKPEIVRPCLNKTGKGNSAFDDQTITVFSTEKPETFDVRSIRLSASSVEDGLAGVK